MSPVRGSRTHGSPSQPSIFAAESLPPAYPRRAARGTAGSLRAWQAAALRKYLSAMPQDFLAVATPGSGKTTFALRVATELLAAGDVHRVTIVCPTEHLKYQWAEAAARVGIRIDPSYTNSQAALGSRFNGVALTYAQVAANANLHRARTDAHRTLVVLDEIHHGGDALSWGEAIREAFTPARRRLALTGTPFRSDAAPIPFVRYVEEGGGVKRSRADYSYDYAHALRDGVVRPVMFLSYSGQMRWRTRTGEEIAARLGEPLTKDMQAQAWRTALDPDGEWIPAVLAAADQRLTEVRRQMPDAGGLVIASDQTRARAYAARLRTITGEEPTVVLSDDTGASSRIETFAASTDRWMVAVRMVSEGVDVPRLAVGVYATSTSTPLFFAQAVGRFVRSRAKGETASVFLPSVAPLLALAGELEVARDHVLGRPPSEEDRLFAGPEDRLIAEANRQERASADLLGAFEAMGSTAEFDRVLFDGGEFGTGAVVGSAEEQEYLGLPGLLEPEQVTALLRQRQNKQIEARRRQSAASAGRRAGSGADDARRRAAARKELSQLVSAWARRSGQPHGVVHNDLRRACGGPQVAAASTEEIVERVETLRRWFVGRR
ncbi:hypothetical protein AM609_03580 [Actinomyces sp. oral taxon 414]|uniref:DEAD/DEAH box helicase n=1 Tax=Actinomyces sp. oral taxon 414 TaxID=712122 RepID=UPI0006ADDAB7|nr:DEAD/DEAH box helicase [Actinomyces sp. oral taxon 414]ALC98795.1 hypothetical protein AM609_03580 [Actinomyces sp. oral taxon 414]